ncbi:uncharacterized protein [Montipora foliosa]|uniref:uncharacterized protein n=1 Tax=Montipora foliosa TaxID=591990 RepID=UPI0035F1F550
MADITVQKIVDFLRNVRKVEPAVLQKFEENKIDGAAVRQMEECHFATLGLIAMGDQLALKEFCAPNVENWDEEVERPRGVLNRRRKRSGNADYGGSIVAQKRAKKITLRVEFGWKHCIGDRCVQVKKDKGVGKRTLDMKRSANYQECLLKAQNIFFPNGTSQHGMLVDMERPYLANYNGDKINEEGFTVEDYKESTGVNVLRLYLVTKAKTQADSTAHAPLTTPSVPMIQSAVMPQLTSFKPLSQEEVQALIAKVPIKSCPLDPIPSSVFAQPVDVLLTAITFTINLSFEIEQFASIWKEALVPPALKQAGLEVV